MPKRTGECGDDQSDHGGPKKPKRSGGLGVHLQGSPPFSEDMETDVKTRRCRNILFSHVDESGHGQTNSDDALSIEEGFFHAAVRKCGDGQNGGSDGQGQNTTSNPPKTASSGTQSTGTSTPTTSMDSGVGGSEPPGGGRGNPPIPGHYSDHQGGGESNGENPGNNAGVTCNGCSGQPKSVKVFFTSEDTGDVRTVKGVNCSQKCAENGRTGSEVVFSVNLWDTETSSFKRCSTCFEFKSMPLTVCLECASYMCGECSRSCKVSVGKFRCSYQCKKGVITCFLPACIAEPARLMTLKSPSPLLAYLFEKGNMMFRLFLWMWHEYRIQVISGNWMFGLLLWMMQESPVLDTMAFMMIWLFLWMWHEYRIRVISQRERAESHQRLLLEEQLRRHQRQQDDENRRLGEANHPQGSFPEAVEDQGSRLLVDELEFGTALGPPTEEYRPPTEDVEQETYDPVVEEDLSEQESTQPQEVPNILPALTESEVTDDDEGFEETSTE